MNMPLNVDDTRQIIVRLEIPIRNNLQVQRISKLSPAEHYLSQQWKKQVGMQIE